ncbi:unnamed protein product [Danaus chrysippus]|uniref:(African queen) hypothetical protein n=1 Tax=Danaus chrysippus TaxID=151541 RepID=A0A8J2RCM3_9NEOP|nr:unnamed protein product [Danaus chrysippus]
MPIEKERFVACGKIRFRSERSLLRTQQQCTERVFVKTVNNKHETGPTTTLIILSLVLSERARSRRRLTGGEASTPTADLYVIHTDHKRWALDIHKGLNVF